MKKILYSAAALALAFFAASCQQENLEPVVGGNTVSYTVQVPQALATKGIGDVAPAEMELHYEVYRTTDGNDVVLGDDTRLLYHKTATITDGTATVEMELVNEQNFTVLFWAQMKDNGVYNVESLKNVTLETEITANQEAYAAFTGVDFIEKGEQLGNRNVSLIRPLAQVNVATTPESLTQFDTDITVNTSAFTVSGLSTTFNVATQLAGTDEADFSYEAAPVPATTLKVNDKDYTYVAMNYVGFAPAAGATVTVTYAMTTSEGAIDNEIQNVPVKPNYRTNIIGNLISESSNYTITLDTSWDAEYNVEGDNVTTNTYVTNADEFNAAFAGASSNDVITLSEDVNLNDLLATRSETVADPTYTLVAGKTLTIDLNGKTLSATSAQVGKIYNMFDVRGTLTVKNGNIEYEHVGENMGWSNSTNLFNVTAGGVLNLDGVTAKNLGGSDMGFVAHLNNWGEVTLNADNCTLESNYVAVRVFNSGYDMNNVTIKNSTLKGNSAAFWVHNYTVADFGSEAKAESQKALLNLNIYNQGNTFSPDLNGVRYGFTNSVRSDAYGITKTVSEDGTVVTLGSVVDNGLVRRGVAGAEENTTITKVVVEEGVGVLYDRTFRRFYALETVELPSTLTTIGAAGSGVFQSCTNLKNIVLPESVTVLGKGSFQECSSLESINIPAGLTRIESDALRATGLKSVEFHENVTYFGAQAFRDCKQLTKVVINAPEFTMEGNTFGIMAAPFTPMTIEVANAEMKEYVESMLTAHAKTYITVVAPEVVNNTSDLQATLAEGKNVILANDLTIAASEMVGAPYGNKTAVVHNGGVFDGNGKTINQTAGGDNYVVMTNGGTIKNLTINEGFRGIVVMNANQTVYLDNVVCSGEVCYAFNTAEGDSTQDVVATNCTFDGWSSWSLLKSATFTNCSFGQGTYYTNVYGRLGKPYVNTLFDGCEFCSKYYIDLSALGADQKVTLKNCTVNGVKLTAQNWTSLVAPEDTCGEGQISIELKNGTYMTADNVADYIVFE